MSKRRDSVSILASNTNLIGNITSESNLRIDGFVEGEITVGSKLFIGKDALVKGNIQANIIDIYGQINGNITAPEIVYLRSHAQVKGDIQAKEILTEMGSIFNGKLKIGH